MKRRIFIGLSAAAVGLLGLVGIDLPNWVEWLIFSLLAITTMLTFRRRVYEMLRGSVGHVEERLEGVTMPGVDHFRGR